MLKRIKKFFIVTIILSLFTPILVGAVKENSNSAGNSTNQNKTQAQTQNQTQKMENLRNRAYQEIDRRVASLNKLIERIGTIKKLTTEQKNAFIKEIQDNIASLTALRTKIQGDTDLETLKTDVKSIVSSYRIYLLFMPKIRLLAAADVALDVAETLTDIATKLEAKIAEAKLSGKDVTSLETALADMKAKIAEATEKAEEVQNSIIPLKPEDYPGNKAALESARASIKTVHKDLITARQDAKTIIQGLKKLSKTVQ